VDAHALANMVARSSHPKSMALKEALSRKTKRFGEGALAFDATADVREIMGLGVELRRGASVYRLGSPRFAGAGRGDLVLVKDGTLLLDVDTDEALRPDATREIEALRGDGVEPWILSGDREARVRKLAGTVGVAADRAIGDQTPEGKRAWVGAHPTALFVGDGINDGLVSEAAFASGTPAIDRPFMASRCDFYFTTPGLHPVRLALRVARHLRRTTTQTLWIAMAYNVLTVSLALAGLMSPVVCAIVMPVSSLTTVLYVTRAFSRKHPVWTS
jgi:Cu2+-exporting ATPase